VIIVDLQQIEMKDLIQVWRKKMNVKYLGKQSINCQMCSKHNNQSYEYKLLFADLYPKDHKKSMIICEKCAQRESGKKRWLSIKRNKL
jgi:hypothetical protein